MAAHCVPKATPNRSGFTILSSRKIGKAAPYGVYDIAANEGWVNSASITTRRLSPSKAFVAGGNRLGKKRYANKAKRLLITADCGGSNGARCVYGKSSYKNSPMKPVFLSPSPIIRPAPANGTASNTACSHLSASTGAGDRSSAIKSSFN